MSDAREKGLARALTLATDLDGTFAGGTAAERAALTAALAAHPAARLIYVTGRAEASARALVTRAALPVPDVLISDVGTNVLRGLGPERFTEIEERLGADWPGGAAVRARLGAISEMEEQDVRAPRRVSYWIAPNRRLRGGGGADFEARGPEDASLTASAGALARAVAEEARAALAPLAVDVLVSGNVYLDVLPRGVHKGSTLRLVLHALGADESSCVVAGDSLNDRALFEMGARGIMVANCEPALRDALRGRDDVYPAAAAGAGGVHEGLRRYGALPARDEDVDSAADQKGGSGGE